MKNFWKYAACMMAAVLMTAACSKDDENSSSSSGGSTTPPALQIPSSSTPVRYEATQDGGKIDFVELPANGTYIIGLRASYDVKMRGMIAASVVEGKSTPQENNVYQLDGFGTVQVKTTEAGDGYLLAVTPQGGSTEEVPVTLKKATLLDGESKKLCATWNLATIRLQMRILTSRFDKEYTDDQLGDMQTDVVAYLKDAIPDAIQSSLPPIENLIDIQSLVAGGGLYHRYTMTSLGTLVLESAYETKAGTWRWADSNKKSIEATLPYGDSFSAGISYRGEQLCLQPQIDALEQMMSQFGAIGSLAFSWELDLYCDKAK